MERDALQKAIDVAGGQSALARAIAVRQSTLNYWVLKAGKCPAEKAPAIEAATGVPRHELRPDIFPPPLQRAAS